MQRIARLAVSVLVLVPVAAAKRHLPGEAWSRYADPAEAGWSTEGLAAARALWEEIDSAAYMIVEDGVVVAAWGDCERRYMCHSVRKSFLSASVRRSTSTRARSTPRRTLARAGHRRRARADRGGEARAHRGPPALALRRLQAGRLRAAPEPQAASAAAYAPGDLLVLQQLRLQHALHDLRGRRPATKVFEAFDARTSAAPSDMQDYRPCGTATTTTSSTSRSTPPIPFRLSARDSARFGLLLYLLRGGLGRASASSARNGWPAARASYSETGQGDGGFGGYGYMWWIFDPTPNVPGPASATPRAAWAGRRSPCCPRRGWCSSTAPTPTCAQQRLQRRLPAWTLMARFLAAQHG